MTRTRGKVAVVTGAASGIGQELSLGLARRGCRLALADVDQDGLDRVRQQVEALGVEAVAHRVDVRDRDAVRRLAQTSAATTARCTSSTTTPA